MIVKGAGQVYFSIYIWSIISYVVSQVNLFSVADFQHKPTKTPKFPDIMRLPHHFEDLTLLDLADFFIEKFYTLPIGILVLIPLHLWLLDKCVWGSTTWRETPYFLQVLFLNVLCVTLYHLTHPFMLRRLEDLHEWHRPRPGTPEEAEQLRSRRLKLEDMERRVQPKSTTLKCRYCGIVLENVSHVDTNMRCLSTELLMRVDTY